MRAARRERPAAAPRPRRGGRCTVRSSASTGLGAQQVRYGRGAVGFRGRGRRPRRRRLLPPPRAGDRQAGPRTAARVALAQASVAAGAALALAEQRLAGETCPVDAAGRGDRARHIGQPRRAARPAPPRAQLASTTARRPPGCGCPSSAARPAAQHVAEARRSDAGERRVPRVVRSTAPPLQVGKPAGVLTDMVASATLVDAGERPARRRDRGTWRAPSGDRAQQPRRLAAGSTIPSRSRPRRFRRT